MDKEKLLKVVQSKLNKKIEYLEHLIAELRASNTDTKSSMGDKYETGREMLQQEINQLQLQLNELTNQMVQLEKLPLKANTTAINGALVKTNTGYYFISVSAGEVVLNGEKIMAISPETPLAKALYGKSAGEQFLLNHNVQMVEQIN